MTESEARADLRRFLAVMACGLLAGAIFPWVANRGLVFVAGTFWINMVFGMAFNLLFRTSGILSFGQAMFYAAGAYLLAVLSLKLPSMPFLVSLALAGAAGAALAAVVGVVALRRTEGVYFSVLTLAFAELIHIVITKTTLLGRNDGLTGIGRPVIEAGPLRLDLSVGDSFYYFVMVVCALLVAVLWVVTRGAFGRAMAAIRQDPQRAAFLGMPVQRYRLVAFAISGAVTAIAGALVAPWLQLVTPEVARWSNSTNPILYTLLGGSGFFWGPAVGAAILSAVFYATRTLAGIADLVTGGMLLAVVLALPGGVLGLLARLRGERVPGRGAQGGGHG